MAAREEIKTQTLREMALKSEVSIIVVNDVNDDQTLTEMALKSEVSHFYTDKAEEGHNLKP